MRSKPTEKKKLEKRANKLWYEHNLREKCEVCGSKYIIQVHHFYYRRTYPHLKFDDDNAVNLCKKCHFKLHRTADPKKITDIIIEKRGETWANMLKEKSKHCPSSFQNITYYEEIIKNLS